MGTEKPRALRALEENRKAIVSADIQWSLAYDLRRSGKAKRFFRWRMAANGDRVTVRRGDEKGVVYYDSAGKPAIVGVERELRRSGDTWRHRQGGIDAAYWPDKRRFRTETDLLALGLLPEYQSTTRLSTALWTYPVGMVSPRKYSEKIVDGIHVVTAELAKDQKLVWHINPAKGWNAERVQVVYQGKVMSESVSVLKKFDNVWFPQAVAYYSPGRANPIHRVEIKSASFNRPDHPRSFGPQDIGIDAGLPISVQGPRAAEFGSVCFDGEKATSKVAFWNDVKAGRRKLGPRFDRLAGELSKIRDAQIARREAARPWSERRLERAEGEWERYTRLFIQKHRLVGPQRASALAVLKDCQKSAAGVFQNRHKQLESLREREAKLSTLGPPHRQKEHAAIAEARSKILDKINDIFDKQLKPRLTGLLTSEQRRAEDPKEKGAPS